MSESNTIVESLIQHAKARPDLVAYRYVDSEQGAAETMTYQQLLDAAQVIASQLMQSAIVGDRIVLVFEPGLDFIRHFFGCLLAGLVAVPVYPPAGSKTWPRFALLVKDCGATMIVCDKNNQPFLLSQYKALSQPITLLCTKDLHHLPQYHPQPLHKDQLAFIQYTSGTTGSPKGVMISHLNLRSNLALLRQAYDATPSDHMVSWLPVYHDMGLVGAILAVAWISCPLTFAAPLYFIRKPIRWMKLLSQYRATITGCPNFGYALCHDRIAEAELTGLDLSSVKTFCVGAERTRPETIAPFIKRFKSIGVKQTAFINCYGMAETTLVISSTDNHTQLKTLVVDKQQLAEYVITESEEGIDLTSCGKPRGHKIIIVNPNSYALCKEKTVGEIWVSGLSVSQGYWQNSTLTSAHFNLELAYLPNCVFFRTGDLGFIYDDELFVCGRKKELIILHGRNYYPQDIEQIIAPIHAAIRKDAIAAFAIESTHTEQLVVVLEIYRKALNSINLSDLAAEIRYAISQALGLMLKDVKFVKQSSLPFTSSNKLQRQRIKEHYLNGSLALIKPVERKVTAIMAE